MNLIQTFVDNPVKVSVGVLLVMLFGILAVFRLPIQLTPEVQTPTITIETFWPGASPQEVEREIVQEQEDVLKSVEGVTKMESESTDSQGTITLEFAVGTDIDKALLLVNSRLQQVPSYPQEADQPVITTANSSDQPIAWLILSNMGVTPAQIEAFIGKHPELDSMLRPIMSTPNPGLVMLQLQTVAAEHPVVNELIPSQQEVSKFRKFAEDNIESRLERVPGISNSNVFGGREEELQVIVDPQKMAARQITVGDLRQALAARNVDTSAGDFWEGKRRWVVRTLGRYDSPEQVADTLIKNVGDRPVYVRDVAQVELGYKKPTGVVRQFGQEVIAINCIRSSGANVLEAMKGIKEAIEEMNADVLHPKGLHLELTYEETDYIYSSLDLVRNNIIIGGILTVLCLLLFLRSGRSTLVIALAIPTSIVGTFLVMSLMGRTLNVVSLAGTAFAVGMLVDNAVVVLENIYRHYQMGKQPMKAAVVGTQEVWGAVLASTATTLAVFIPVLFVQEQAGQLFRDIALSISAAVALSLIVSVSVIPTAGARLLKPHKAGADPAHDSEMSMNPILAKLLMPLFWIGDVVSRAIIGLNTWVQRGFIRQIGTVILIIFLAVGGIVLLFPKLEYLPTGNKNLVFGILLPPPGYNLEMMGDIGKQIEQQLRPYWDLDYSDPDLEKDLEFPAIGNFFYVTINRSIFLGLRAYNEERARELMPLIQQVMMSSPGAIGFPIQASLFEQGLQGGRSIEVEVIGPDLEQLVAIGGRMMGQVQELMPGANARPVPSLDLSSPEVHVIPRWEQAAAMNVSAQELGYAVDALVDGAYASDYYSLGEKIDLSIVGQDRFVQRTQDLGGLSMATGDGQLVPLSAVANILIDSGPEQVNRRERQRAITIEISPPDRMPLEQALSLIREEMIKPVRDDGMLEGGYRIQLSGTADKLAATWDALELNFVIAILITYLLMAALFESWLYPLVIILSVPMAAVGGIIGLWLQNIYLSIISTTEFQALDVLTMLGFVILVGTAVNNAILIVHQALNNMKDGMNPNEAIVESVRTRIRPIFMTTTTTTFGLFPLVVLPGSGSELYRGLGSVVLGGLVCSTLLTLILVPTVFHLFMSTKEKVVGESEVSTGSSVEI